MRILSTISFAFVCVITASVQAAPLDEVSIILEQNATDGDAEVVFQVTSGDEGLSALTITAPNQRVVIDFKSPDLKLGMRHLQLESPEPEDLAAIKADYPAGVYTFEGTSAGGEKLTGKATLSHQLPATAQFIHPLPDADDVPAQGLVIRWKAVPNMKACIVVIEQEDTGLEVSARLPGSATSFAAPDGFLQPGTDYKFAIGTIGANGNTSYGEAEFTTAK